MLFNEQYIAFAIHSDINTEETIEAFLPNLETGDGVSPFRALLVMTQDMEIRHIIDELKDDPLVDNINIVLKGDIGPKFARIGIYYHRYSEGETPNYSDPNRLYVFFIVSQSEFVRIQEQYGDDVESYREAVLNGVE